jgi:hypothetical protein
VVEAAVTVTVMVVAVIAVEEVAANCGVVPVTTTSGTDAVLNSNPDGIVRTKVPTAISPEAPSDIVMAPNVVQASPGAPVAVSAEMAPPPAAGVTVELALAGVAVTRLKLSTSRKVIISPSFLPIFLHLLATRT